MVLIEIVELIIDINGCLNFVWDINIYLAELLELRVCFLVICLKVFFARTVVLSHTLKNLFTQNVEDNTNSEEDHTENTEGKHCAHCSWYWSPSWQRIPLNI
jgi:hypothetical protein